MKILKVKNTFRILRKGGLLMVLNSSVRIIFDHGTDQDGNVIERARNLGISINASDEDATEYATVIGGLSTRPMVTIQRVDTKELA